MQTADADTAYAALIAELSPILPRCLEPRDITLDQDDIAIVAAKFGAAHFLSDALNHQSENGTDTIDALAVRMLAPLETAITGCGLAVLTAARDYARQLVFQDVVQYRRIADGHDEPEFWGDIADRAKHEAVRA